MGTHHYTLTMVNGTEYTMVSEYDSINSAVGMHDVTTYAGNMFMEVTDVETQSQVFLNMGQIVSICKVD